MKLNTKVNVFTTLVASFTLACSFIAVYFLYKSLAINTEYDQLLSRADDLAMAVSSLESAEGVDTLIRTYLPTDGYLVVVDEVGEPIIRMQASNVPLPEIDVTNEAFKIFDLNAMDHLALNYPLLWPDVGVTNVLFVQPIPHIAKNLQLLRLILVSLMVLAIIPIYFASNGLARIITRPISSLTSLMQKNIERQSFEQIPMSARSKDEIANMTRTYNALMDELEKSYMRQQQFVGNASHELKTPLTVIESYASLLQRRGLEDLAMTKEAIDAISAESKSMKAMIEQMLMLSKSIEMTRVDVVATELDELLLRVANQISLSFNRKVMVNCDPLTIWTDVQILHQILVILLDNARKYSDEFSDIAITVHSVEHSITISVADHGIGIPPEDLPHIFDRFYRVTKDRNRKTGGTGLGLSIASQLAGLIQGKLRAESTVGIGTTIHLTIPISLEAEVSTDE